MDKRIGIVFSILSGIAIGTIVSSQTIHKELEKEKGKSYRYLALYALMNQWIKVKQDGRNLSIFFEKKGYRRIAIYGMGYAGTTLVDELQGTDTKVEYAIDKNAETIASSVKIVTLKENLESVDAVVVTPISFYDEIRENLRRCNVTCPIISLEDVVFSL